MRPLRFSRTHATIFAALVLAPSYASAQDLAGSYRVTRDSTAVTVPSWGADCGPRPSPQSGRTGQTVTVTADANNFEVQDGRRRRRSDGCWSENPSVRRITATHAGSRWTVLCRTAESEYQQESGTYTLSADSGRISLRDESEYHWQLRGSECRANAVRTLVLERVDGPSAQPSASASVAPTASVRPSATAAAPPPSPPPRCATVGPAVRLELTPSRRSLAPGGRGCFRARVLDASRCEVTGTQVQWQPAHRDGAPDLAVSDGCVSAPASAGQGEYAVVATAGAFTERAVAAVVSADQLRTLLAAHIEDEDPGPLPSASAGSASGAGVGAVVVQPGATNAVPPRATPVWLWALLGLGVTGALAAVVLLARRKGPARDTSSGGERESASSFGPPANGANNSNAPRASDPLGSTGPQSWGSSAPPPAPIVAAPPVAPPPAPEPPKKRCPVCQQLFSHEIAFCPEHGTSLVDEHGASAPPSGPAPGPAAMPVAIAPAGPPRGAELRCPKCGKTFERGTAFCGEDGSTLVENR